MATWKPDTLNARSLRGILLASSMLGLVGLGLAGCVSATGELSSVSTNELAARQRAKAEQAQTQQIPTDNQLAAGQQPGDPQVALNANPDQLYPVADPSAPLAAQPGQPALDGRIVLQPANIEATKSSIYASADPALAPRSLDQQAADIGGQQPVAADADANPVMVPIPTVNPLKSSLFSADLAPVKPAQQIAVAEPGQNLEQGDIPGRDAALVPLDQAGKQGDNGEEPGASPDANAVSVIDPLPNADPMPALQGQVQKPAAKKKFSLADFFKKKQKTSKFDADRFGKTKTVDVAAMPNMNNGDVSVDALPGVSTANAMFPTVDSNAELSTDEHEEGEPAGLMTLASLPSLMRTAPNGLLLQTDKVEIRCLRPQLIRMLKHIEAHYSRPVIVTSGFRDTRHNRQVGGARGSLHTLCAAADIQIEGVTKWQLAEYLRSIEGRGGVGTYCHTDSVHIDVGEERDWNWRCRRKKRKHG